MDDPQDMMADHPLMHLIHQANSEEDMGDDDRDAGDYSSQHDHSTPSDHSDSTPSEIGPDGGEPSSSSQAASGGAKKRKSQGTDANGNAKPVKKRASQACEICRSRKVRCDSEKRHPCTNCADMGLECHIPESKRRR